MKLRGSISVTGGARLPSSSPSSLVEQDIDDVVVVVAVVLALDAYGLRLLWGVIMNTKQSYSVYVV
jgi:hypothetical protein